MKRAFKRIAPKLRARAANPHSVKSKQQFIQWLKRKDPFLYKTARRVALLRGQQLSGTGEFDWGNFFQSAVDTVKTALPTYLQTQQQKDIMKIQVDRARQGLPPLDATQYTAPIQIAPTITPETEAAMNRVAVQTVSSGVSKLLPWLALGAGAFLLLRKRGRR